MVSQVRIRVLIVDDNPTTRLALRFFIEVHPDFQLIGEASSGEEAIEFCEQTEPDVILMDIRMHGSDGIATTVAIKQRHPRVQVIALSSFSEPNEVAEAYKAGVHTYLQKSAPGPYLTDAIRSAYSQREGQA